MHDKYYFKGIITKELAVFNTHLVAKGFNKNTIQQYCNYTGIFLTWIEEEAIEKDQVRYSEIIAFIRHLQNEEYNSKFINRIILAVRHYYDFFETEKSAMNEVVENPASGIYLRGGYSVHSRPSIPQ